MVDGDPTSNPDGAKWRPDAQPDPYAEQPGDRDRYVGKRRKSGGFFSRKGREADPVVAQRERIEEARRLIRTAASTEEVSTAVPEPGTEGARAPEARAAAEMPEARAAPEPMAEVRSPAARVHPPAPELAPRASAPEPRPPEARAGAEAAEASSASTEVTEHEQRYVDEVLRQPIPAWLKEPGASRDEQQLTEDAAQERMAEMRKDPLADGTLLHLYEDVLARQGRDPRSVWEVPRRRDPRSEIWMAAYVTYYVPDPDAAREILEVHEDFYAEDDIEDAQAVPEEAQYIRDPRNRARARDLVLETLYGPRYQALMEFEAVEEQQTAQEEQQPAEEQPVQRELTRAEVATHVARLQGMLLGIRRQSDISTHNTNMRVQYTHKDRLLDLQRLADELRSTGLVGPDEQAGKLVPRVDDGAKVDPQLAALVGEVNAEIDDAMTELAAVPEPERAYIERHPERGSIPIETLQAELRNIMDGDEKVRARELRALRDRSRDWFTIRNLPRDTEVHGRGQVQPYELAALAPQDNQDPELKRYMRNLQYALAESERAERYRAAYPDNQRGLLPDLADDLTSELRQVMSEPDFEARQLGLTRLGAELEEIRRLKQGDLSERLKDFEAAYQTAQAKLLKEHEARMATVGLDIRSQNSIRAVSDEQIAQMQGEYEAKLAGIDANLPVDEQAARLRAVVHEARTEGFISADNRALSSDKRSQEFVRAVNALHQRVKAQRAAAEEKARKASLVIPGQTEAGAHPTGAADTPAGSEPHEPKPSPGASQSTPLGGEPITKDGRSQNMVHEGDVLEGDNALPDRLMGRLRDIMAESNLTYREHQLQELRVYANRVRTSSDAELGLAAGSRTPESYDAFETLYAEAMKTLADEKWRRDAAQNVETGGKAEAGHNTEPRALTAQSHAERAARFGTERLTPDELAQMREDMEADEDAAHAVDEYLSGRLTRIRHSGAPAVEQGLELSELIHDAMIAGFITNEGAPTGAGERRLLAEGFLEAMEEEIVEVTREAERAQD